MERRLACRAGEVCCRHASLSDLPRGQSRRLAAAGKTHGTINREIGLERDPVTAIVMRVLTAIEDGEDPFTPENLASTEERSGE